MRLFLACHMVYMNIYALSAVKYLNILNIKTEV